MPLFSNCAFCPWNKLKPTSSFLRILHASPGTAPVDIYAGSVLLAENLGYRFHTDYLPVLPGEYVIRMFPTGTTTAPALTRRIMIPPNTAITAAAVGHIPGLVLHLFPEPVPTRQAFIRFIHLSPNAPHADLALQDGTVLFRKIGYGERSPYTPIEEGAYTLQIHPAGANTAILTIPQLQVKRNNYYTIFATGSSNGTPPLQAVFVRDYGKY